MNLNPLSHSSGSMDSANPTAVPFGTIYKFTKVFAPSDLPTSSIPAPADPNSQANFFKETTLPLIQDLFDGQNCLLFAYGPTGSGKTWTVQGGAEDPGLLPRAMDVIWNSVKGKESQSMVSHVLLLVTESFAIAHPQNTIRSFDRLAWLVSR